MSVEHDHELLPEGTSRLIDRLYDYVLPAECLNAALPPVDMDDSPVRAVTDGEWLSFPDVGGRTRLTPGTHRTFLFNALAMASAERAIAIGELSELADGRIPREHGSTLERLAQQVNDAAEQEIIRQTRVKHKLYYRMSGLLIIEEVPGTSVEAPADTQAQFLRFLSAALVRRSVHLEEGKAIRDAAGRSNRTRRARTIGTQRNRSFPLPSAEGGSRTIVHKTGLVIDGPAPALADEAVIDHERPPERRLSYQKPPRMSPFTAKNTVAPVAAGEEPPDNESATKDNWRKWARCRNEDPELFFPVGKSVAAKRQTKEAEAFCEPCQVRADCLRWALKTRQSDGVWGGTSEDARKRMLNNEELTP